MRLRDFLSERRNDLVVVDHEEELRVGDALPARAGLSGQRIAVSFDSTAQLVRTLVEADGDVASLLLIPASAGEDDVRRLMEASDTAVLLTDRAELPQAARPHPSAPPTPASEDEPPETEWLIATSGSSGPSKLRPHTLASLTHTIPKGDDRLAGARWGLLYDPTRFAGLQVVLHALLNDGTLLAAHHHGSLADRVDRLISLRCDHLSATPSLWRRLLMHPRAQDLPLQRATLGGEAADGAILTKLTAAFPDAKVSHIYASTEAGVGFTVTDGKPGFPASYLEPDALRGISMKIRDGRLWVHSAGATRASGGAADIVRDEAGYVDTGDVVELRDDRVVFLGRTGSGVNVGGVTVFPDDVESVLYEHPSVRLCRVAARSNPVTGALLYAEIVPADPHADAVAIKRDVTRLCRERLIREAVPRKIVLVDELGVASSGKLIR